jgi:excisionase family DNA binding protein
MVTTNKPLWFSIAQAAEYLNVGEPTLYRWMRDGKITFRKVGDSTRFLQEDLDEVVQVVKSQKKALEVRQTCPACGGPDLVEGTIRTTGLVHFQPAKTKFWTLADSTVGIAARMCGRCGVISLLGDQEKLVKLLTNEGAEGPEAPQKQP